MRINVVDGCRVLLVIAVLATLVACADKQFSDRDLVYVDSGEAASLLSGEPGGFLGLGGSANGILVDARRGRAFTEGHIPGASHLPFERVTQDHEAVLRGRDVIVVYGDGYHDPRAEGMSKRLMELGYEDVRVLRGGVRAWTDAGHALEPATRSVTAE